MKGETRQKGTMLIDDHDTAVGEAEKDESVVGCPTARGNARRDAHVEHMAPVALTVHRAHQHEAVFIADHNHAAVVAPREIADRRSAIVYQLDRPSTFVLDPHVNNTL